MKVSGSISSFMEHVAAELPAATDCFNIFSALSAFLTAIMEAASMLSPAPTVFSTSIFGGFA